MNFLDVEASYYDWQANTHEQRTDAETARIQAAKSSAQSHLSRQNDALARAELKSPANGTFVYAQTPWGRKVSRGQTVFPGGSVGMLPVDGKVQARIYVPKSDALGVEIKQKVRFSVDSEPELELMGQVHHVSPIATQRSRDDPRTYILVLASVSEEDAHRLRVGSALTATILTADLADVIALPQQAVSTGDNESFVYVISGAELKRRTVTVGSRNPTMVEIVDGLNAGEWVSLVAPQTPRA